MDRDPIQLIGRDPEILVFGTEDFERAHVDLNVDVEVHLNGDRWAATFFSIANVQTLFERWAREGDGASGTYLWAPDMIIVREVSAHVIRTTVSELLARDEFSQAFMRLASDDSLLERSGDGDVPVDSEDAS